MEVWVQSNKKEEIMEAPIARMGRKAGKHMTNYHADLIRDGMMLQKYGEDRPYLWLLRETGTDLFLLDEQDGMIAEASNTIVERADHCFLLKHVDSAENGIFVSIPKFEAKALLEILHPLKFGTLYMERKIQALIDLYE
jgi:hypothetical protein